MTTDRVQKAAADAFERAIKRTVERVFAIAKERGVCETPVTGDEWGSDLSPERYAELMARAVKAVLARKWFEDEAPKWACPLPVSRDEITALLNGVHQGKHRPRMRSQYGEYLRARGWRLEHVTPFELYFTS
jgi:hypothetical protein